MEISRDEALAALDRVEAYLKRRSEMYGLHEDINIVWTKDEALPLNTDDLELITDKLRGLL